MEKEREGGRGGAALAAAANCSLAGAMLHATVACNLHQRRSSSRPN